MECAADTCDAHRMYPQRCGPLSQQPVGRQMGWRAGQLVTQDEGLRGALVVVQIAMQAFASSLQRSAYRLTLRAYR